MWEPEFKERGLVRVVCIFATRYSGHVSAESMEDAEKHGNLWAVGAWHRDDEDNLKCNLEHDKSILCHSYAQILGTDYAGGIVKYEYKPYKDL